MTDALLQELRRQYRDSARERLEEVGRLLDAAGSVQAEGLAVTMTSLARHFHAFSGMGATYGFPRISVLGDELEASIAPFIRSGAAPDAGTMARWRELLREIAAELC
jgi:HPt (histidine-containing phosphotransfer) domain-containing protein